MVVNLVLQLLQDSQLSWQRRLSITLVRKYTVDRIVNGHPLDPYVGVGVILITHYLMMAMMW